MGEHHNGLHSELAKAGHGHGSILIFVDGVVCKLMHLYQRLCNYLPGNLQSNLNWIIPLSGVLASVISDRGPHLIIILWGEVEKLTGMLRKLSSVCYPQSDGQTEGTKSTLEEMHMLLQIRMIRMSIYPVHNLT